MADAGEMTKRQITMADGRYLIFYTFGEAPPPSVESSSSPPARKPEARAQAEAAEERDV